MEYVVAEEQLKSIADAIREKTGTADGIVFPDGFVTAVSAIETGGGSEEDVIAVMCEEKPCEYYSADVTKVRHYMFAYSTIKSIRMPKVKHTGMNIFSASTIGKADELLRIDEVFPALEEIGLNSFSGLKNKKVSVGGIIKVLNQSCFSNSYIEEIELGQQITTIKSNVLGSAPVTKLTINLPNLDQNGIVYGAFSSMSKLTSLKVLCANIINRNAFGSCRSLKTVFFSKNIGQILAPAANNSPPFYLCTSLTDIYTDAPEKPSGWSDYFNYMSASGFATVHYGVSEEEYDAIVSG